MAKLFGVVLLAGAFRVSTAVSGSTAMITEAEVQEAQRSWGNSIVDIGKIEADGGDFEARAGRFVDSLYALDVVDVLFKPTMAEDTPFRTTRSGVISYFIANQPDEFPEDVRHGGFARHPWQKVRFEVSGNWYGPGAALSQGHYIFTDMDGIEHIAEFSFAYVRDSGGHLRLALHHSSFPFCGEEFVTNQPCMLSSETDLAAGKWSSPLVMQQRRVASATVATSAVLSSEQVWGDGVVDLGEASAEDVHGEAVDFVAHSYAYSVAMPYNPPKPWTAPGALFKPTKARVAPFRTTLDGAVSYFVGGDSKFAEDHGFALQPWTQVRFEAAGTTQLIPALAVTMGHYIFTATDGKEHKAEYSLAFVSADTEHSPPLIALHHSSFPFCSTCRPASAAAASDDGASHFGLGLAVVVAAIGLAAVVCYKRKENQSDARVALLHNDAEAL